MNGHIVRSQIHTNKIIYEPIGFFHTRYSEETGVPRQGTLQPDKDGTIEIIPLYRDALKKLESNEYIIVLYHLDKVKGWESLVKPGGIDSNEKHGLFATRTPARPNPIGFSVLRLNKIEDGILYISGLDAFDGTPVLDIKPFIPSLDCPPNNSKREIKSYNPVR